MRYSNPFFTPAPSENDGFPATRTGPPQCADELGVKQAGLQETRQPRCKEFDVKQQLQAEAEEFIHNPGQLGT